MNQTVGRQTFCDLWGAKHLNSTQVCEDALRQAVVAGGATLIECFVHQFSPHGVSGVAVIAESHVAVHTWPEIGYVAIDAFTCGDSLDLEAMIQVLTETYEPDQSKVNTFSRGVTPEEEELNSFTERDPQAAGSTTYKVDRILDRRRTQYQDLLLFESADLGKVLVLDGIVQLAESDTYVYHELLAHPALVAHPDPKNVVIVGGGDGYLLAEVLKHDAVERVWLMELDEEVVQVSRKYFEVARRALQDPRVQMCVGDAFETVATMKNKLDVILCDLTDPIGQAARLFGDSFYGLCSQALRKNGILAAQTESVHFHPRTVRDCRQKLKGIFPHVATAGGAMAMYPGAWWTFTLASADLDPRVARRHPPIETRLYQSREHGWFFIPDSVLEGVVGRGA